MSNNDQIGIKAITNNNTGVPQSFSSFQSRIKLFDKAKSSQLDTKAKTVQFQHSKNYNKFQNDNNNSNKTKDLKLSSINTNTNDIKSTPTINEEDEKRNSFIKCTSVTISSNSIKQVNPKIPSVNPSKKIINKANTIIPSNESSNDKINDLFLPQIEIKESVMNNSLCEGFFISSFPTENAKALENTESFPSTCGHQTCSSLIAMQPEILYRYPSKDSKTLELNNLAASICFPTGIKVCYEDEAEIPTTINYSSSITNQQGDRFYLVTYHFYHKILNSQFITKYQMYPIKYYTMKFCNEFYEKIEDDHKLQKAISKKLEEYSELNFREVVHIPFCICLISKYPYIDQMEKCLESIRASISNYKSTNKEVHRLITHIVKEIPIPPIGHEIKFTLPFINDFISITNPLINDFSYLDKNTLTIFNLFSIDNIVLIFRLILFEQRIVFVDNEYDRLSKITNGFIGLIYPLQ